MFELLVMAYNRSFNMLNILLLYLQFSSDFQMDFNNNLEFHKFSDEISYAMMG